MKYSEYIAELDSTYYGNPLIRLIRDDLRVSKNKCDFLSGVDMYELSRVAPLDFILKYPEGIYGKAWNLKGISANLNVDINFILNTGRTFLLNHQRTLCMNTLSFNTNITKEFMEEYPKGIEGTVGNFFTNPGLSKRSIWGSSWISMQIVSRMSSEDIIVLVRELTTIPGDYATAQFYIRTISSNKNLTPEILMANKKGIKFSGFYKKWVMELLSSNPAIPFKFILDNPLGFCELDAGGEPPAGEARLFEYSQWDDRTLSENPRININFIQEYSKKVYSLTNKFPEWDMFKLTSNEGISIRYILDNPEGLRLEYKGVHTLLKWDKYSVTYNPMKGASDEEIFRYFREYFSGGPSSTFMFVLSCNPGITLEFVHKYPHGIENKNGVSQKWNLEGLSINPNIDYNFLKSESGKDNHSSHSSYSSQRKYSDFLNIRSLSINLFTKARKEREEYIYSAKEKAARVIWYKGWLPYYFNPNTRGKGFDKDKEVFLEHLFHKE